LQKQAGDGFFRNDAREFGVRLTNKINGMLDPNLGIEAKNYQDLVSSKKDG